jgi:hypothetical protein
VLNPQDSMMEPSSTRNAYRIDQMQGLAVYFDGGISDVTFTGARAADIITGQQGLVYLPSQDAYLMKMETAGDVVRISPTTLAPTTQATTGGSPPDSVNGIYTRWLYLPGLKGIAYLPSAASNFWFLATE